MEWYNTTRPHMSLNLDVIETPYQAYLRKMPDEKESSRTRNQERDTMPRRARKGRTHFGIVQQELLGLASTLLWSIIASAQWR